MKSVTRGSPQGSACGPGFWNILYDGALKLPVPDRCELIAFADDLILLCLHRNLRTLEMKVNLAIDQITMWGSKVKMKFNEKKTQAMICTKTRSVPIADFRIN